jgi:hypothetical protein
MTQEETQILLKDLCARMPYSVMYCCKYYSLPIKLRYIGVSSREEYLVNGDFFLQEIKPYLRPMSSMTKEEENKYINTFLAMWDAVDWLNAHHFDFRNLIEKGLALEAPADMYKTE